MEADDGQGLPFIDDPVVGDIGTIEGDEAGTGTLMVPVRRQRPTHASLIGLPGHGSELHPVVTEGRVS